VCACVLSPGPPSWSKKISSSLSVPLSPSPPGSSDSPRLQARRMHTLKRGREEILMRPCAHLAPVCVRERERKRKREMTTRTRWRHLHNFGTPCFPYRFNITILSTIYSTLCRVSRRASSHPSAPLPLPRTPTILSLGVDRPSMPRS
jgi:hypothetical protein